MRGAACARKRLNCRVFLAAPVDMKQMKVLLWTTSLGEKLILPEFLTNEVVQKRTSLFQDRGKEKEGDRGKCVV